MSEHKELIVVLERIAKALELISGRKAESIAPMVGLNKLSLKGIKDQLIEVLRTDTGYGNKFKTAREIQEHLIGLGYSVKLNSLRTILNTDSLFSLRDGYWTVLLERGCAS